jgi:hydroxymethylbilane synthase
MVAERLRAAGGPSCEIVVIKTSGDQRADVPVSQIGGKRLFVKEIEDALLAGAIDLAVHSSKDMPAELPQGLAIGAVLPREDPADALVLPARAPGIRASGIGIGSVTRVTPNPESRTPVPDFLNLDQLRAQLPTSLRIGTGSVRRIVQLIPLFPGARFDNVRGNLDTRLRKLDAGEYHLLVLAAAGLRRLGATARISMTIPLAVCVPAPGQGIIAVEVRADDAGVRSAVSGIDDAGSAAALDAERALVRALGGGCQLPIGAVALPSGPSSLEMMAIVASLDGARVIKRTKTGSKAAAVALGSAVGAALLNDGAAEILSGVQGVSAISHP